LSFSFIGKTKFIKKLNVQPWETTAHSSTVERKPGFELEVKHISDTVASIPLEVLLYSIQRHKVQAACKR